MRIAIIALVALLGMAGAAYYASKRLIVEQKPPPPGPAFRVIVEATGRVGDHEVRIAQPLEEQLAALPGVTRMRTRVTATQVEIDVWAEPLTPLPKLETKQLPQEVPPPLVLRAGARDETHWVVAGEKRPEVPGSIVCGREDAVPTVVLDPVKLQEAHVSALEVDRVLIGKPRTVAELAEVEVAAQVKLRDVATIELQRPSARCTADAKEPVYFVTTPQREVAGGTKLDPVSTIAVRGLAGAVKAVEPAVTTRQDGVTTLWFSPPLTAPQRDAVLDELRQVTSARVLHIDGIPHVRLVITGPERSMLHAIAGTIVATLEHVKGVRLVVPPPEPEPLLQVKVDRERAAALGISAADAAGIVALARSGSAHDGLRVTIPLAEPEHLGAIAIRDRRLADVVMFTNEPEPVELLREDRQRSVEIVAYGIGKKGVPIPALPGGVMLEIYDEL